MKFILFSIALVAFANGVLSSPSKVKLPSDELQDINNKGGEIYQSYLDWKKTLPEGNDNTFQAFLDWLKNNRQLRDFEAEDLESEKRDAESIHPQESRSSSSVKQSNFELSQEDLQQLYKIWRKYAPSDDNSFESFLKWFEDGDELEERNLFAEKPRAIQPFDAENFEPAQEINVAGESRQLATREETGDGLVPDIQGFTGGEVFEAYREWLKTLTEGSDKRFQTFYEFWKKSKTRRARDDVNVNLQQYELERRAENDEGVTSAAEQSTDGYDCAERNPCTVENIVRELFYFAGNSPEKFVQCSAWGICSLLTCPEALIWDDKIKTCNLRT